MRFYFKIEIYREIKDSAKRREKNIFVAEKNEEDGSMQNFEAEVSQLNKYFNNLNLLSDALFDNLDLIKAFLNALFHSYIGIINFTLYEFDLDDSLKIKRQNITYKYSVDTIRIKEWNYCLLFKAYTGLVIIFFKK